jgi:hypothetical protein
MMQVTFLATVSTSQKIFCLMPARKKQIGKDIIIYILSIYLHISQHIRRAAKQSYRFPLGAPVNQSQIAVVETHLHFVAEDGTPMELHGMKR